MAEAATSEFAFLEEADPDRAWSGLLEDCLGTVERAVRRAVGDAEEARDVVAEVLVRIHADWPALIARYKAGRTDLDGSFRPWLAVVVRRLAIDVLRAWHGRAMEPRSVQRMPDVRRRLFQLLYRERRLLEDAFDVVVAEGVFAGGYSELAAEVRMLEDELPASARVAAATPRRPARASGGGGDGAEFGEPEHVRSSGDAPERPHDLVQRRAAHAGLGEILEELNGDERLLLRAYFLEGATAKDVACLVGVKSPRAVYDRVQGLLERLREALGARGLGPEDLHDFMDFDWAAGLAEGGDG